jgi:hypothetical protein
MLYAKFKREGLEEAGPLVKVLITRPGTPPEQQPAYECWGILDTGATHSSVCVSALSLLNLKPVGEASLVTVNGKANRKIYVAQVRFVGSEITISEIPVSDMEDCEYGMVIGRDFLKFAVLLYDGGGVVMMYLPNASELEGSAEKRIGKAAQEMTALVAQRKW